MNYDSGYHLLFANVKLVEDLIHHFVPETWVKQLDFSSLSRVNTKFHAYSLQRREGDIIYRVNLKEGGTLYLYLLLEFQSQTDYWMPVRINTYVCLLYQQLIEEKQITIHTGLPPIFPLVLYNGDKPWKAAVDLRSLIRLPESSPLWAYQPDMRYYVVEERLHPVEQGDSLAGLLFEFEQCRNPAQFVSVISRLTRIISQPQDSELSRAFSQFIKFVLSQKKGIPLRMEDVTELAEVQEMLSTRLEQWQEEYLQQGREEGREEGKSTLLCHLLEHRFGELPSWAQEKLSAADSQTLERWGLNFLEAQTLDKVFQ